MTQYKELKQIVRYILLVVLLGGYPTYRIIDSSDNDISFIFLALLMFAPALAALITLKFNHEKFRIIGLGKPKIKYLGMAYIIPLTSCIIIYGIALVTGMAKINDFVLWETVLNIILAPFIMTLLVIGEEIGWNGYLFPKLYNSYGFHYAAIGTGIIWALFHYPIIFMGDYTSSQPLWFATLFFTLNIIGGSYITGYLRVKSNTIWPAVLMHSTHNVLVQSVFDKSIIENDYTTLLTSEFGMGLAICYLAIGLYLSSRLKKKPQKPIPMA